MLPLVDWDNVPAVHPLINIPHAHLHFLFYALLPEAKHTVLEVILLWTYEEITQCTDTDYTETNGCICKWGHLGIQQIRCDVNLAF